MVITTVRTITEALSPPNRFSTKPAIIAPPPDASSPVPSPVIAPIQISTSQGSSASVAFTGTQPVAKRMVAPRRAILAILKYLLKGAKPQRINNTMQPASTTTDRVPFQRGISGMPSLVTLGWLANELFLSKSGLPGFNAHLRSE